MTYIQGTLPPFPLPNDYEDFTAAIDNWSRETAKYVETNMETVRKAVQEVIWEPGTLDHGDMTGLTDDDHSSLYLLLSGARKLTGNWDVGGYDITNIGTGTFGKVGIGTTSPDSIFHIKANVAGTVGSHPAGQLIIQDPDDTVFGNAVITGYESDGAGNPDQQLWYLGSSSSSNSDIIFLNRRNSKLQLGTNGVSHLTILGNGNIGIGTTNPQVALDVVGAITCTTLQTHANAITTGSKFSYKTGTITPAYTGIVEVISDSSNPLPAGTDSGIDVEAFFDPDDSGIGGFQFGGAFFNKATGTVTGTANIQVGLFGGFQGTIVNNGYSLSGLLGLQFACFNNAAFDGGTNKENFELNTYGLYVDSYLGYDGKTISNYANVENYGGRFAGILDGTYNSTRTDGVNYGVYAKTTDSLTDASGNIVSYGLYIDALAGSTKGSGGVITSWGLYEVNGRDNAFAGNVRIGGLTAPTVALDVTGAALISTTLDVVGNIDPTTYETTRGGFKDEDDMASNSAVATASQQSIKAYTDSWFNAKTVYLHLGGYPVQTDVGLTIIGNWYGARFLNVTDKIVYKFKVPTNWTASSNMTIKTAWALVTAQNANDLLDAKVVIYASNDHELCNAAAVETVTVDHDITDQNAQREIHFIDFTVTGSNLAAGDIVNLWFYRTANANTAGYCDWGVLLHDITVAYTVDSLGD